jgi:hypothetical protein
VPSAPGLKVTMIEHAFWAARVAVHVPPVIEKSAGFGPLNISLRATGCVW